MKARRRALGRVAIACIASGLASPPLLAQGLHIASVDCSQPVHLVADGVPLSVVLRNLSDSLHFVIVYHAETDPLVTADIRSLSIDLVRNVARNMNFSLEEAADPHCAQGRRIARVSVLPDANAGNRSTMPSVPPASQTRGMGRVTRLGLQHPRTRHGVSDQPMEELDGQ